MIGEFIRLRRKSYLRDKPKCAVKASVNASNLERIRLARYLNSRREIAAAIQQRDPALAERTKRRWKSIHKTYRTRSKIDPKLKQ